MRRSFQKTGPALALMALMALTGCPEATVDDEPCQTNDDCGEDTCLDGTCVVSVFCQTDFDCPIGQFCVERTCRELGDPNPDPNPTPMNPDPNPDADPVPMNPDPNPDADPVPMNPDPNPDMMGDCTEDGDCLDTEHCADSTCTDGCHNDDGCMIGQVCDTRAHACVTPGCANDADCPDEQICDVDSGGCVDPPIECGDQTCAQDEWCDYFTLDCIDALPGAPCTINDDCDNAQSCSPSNDALEILALVCRDDEGTIAAGEPCEADGDCLSGLCVLGGCFEACETDDQCDLEGAECRDVPVTPEEGHDFIIPACLTVFPCVNNGDCAEGQVCGLVPVVDTLQALCVDAVGDDPAGAPCAADEDCASGSCFGQTGGIQRCLGICDNDGDCEPGNTACTEITFLVSDGGTPDDASDDTTSDHQVCEWAQGSADPCQTGGDCGDGEVCVLDVGEDDALLTRCRPAWGDEGGGGACEGSNDCQTGLCFVDGVCFGTCDQDSECLGETACDQVPLSDDPDAPEIGICALPPVVCVSDVDCGGEEVCVPANDPDRPNTIITICRPNQGGDGRAGEPCLNNTDCASALCLGQFGTTNRVCYGPCNAIDDTGCNNGTLCYPNWVFLTFDQDTPNANDDRYDSTSACLDDFGSFDACANDSACPSGEMCYPLSNRTVDQFETRCIDEFNPGAQGPGAGCLNNGQCASDFCVGGGDPLSFCFGLCASSADCAGLTTCLAAELAVNDRGTESTLDDITDGLNVCQ